MVVDVDTKAVTTVGGVTGHPSVTGPQVASVRPALGGAYASVWDGLGISTGYFVAADGSARRAGSGTDLIPARSSPAVWTLTRASGGCMLRLVPRGGAAVRAPCGLLQLDTANGLLITNPPYAMLVNDSTGKVLRRVDVPGQVEPINGTYVLENSRPSTDVPGHLTLVNLRTGTRRSLHWPSILPTVQRIAVEPHGPLVAIGFVSVAYPGPQQADDVWLLNTTGGTFTHLPGFPAQESIKASGIAWTSNDHLVVVAESNTDTSTSVVLGIWRPGQTTLPLRTIPTLVGGYNQFVPISG